MKGPKMSSMPHCEGESFDPPPCRIGLTLSGMDRRSLSEAEAEAEAEGKKSFCLRPKAEAEAEGLKMIFGSTINGPVKVDGFAEFF